jgi:hypothetical protein
MAVILSDAFFAFKRKMCISMVLFNIQISHLSLEFCIKTKFNCKQRNEIFFDRKKFPFYKNEKYFERSEKFFQ